MKTKVAPYVGAWIETTAVAPSVSSASSHPTWVRGLKLQIQGEGTAHHGVAPYVGAWIETCALSNLNEPKHVAPYVGAWIETHLVARTASASDVAPYVGAWIETPRTKVIRPPTSRTLRGCVD